MAATVVPTRSRRLHPDRAAGGDHDHRRPDRPAAAGGAAGPRGGAAGAVRQQPQAARAGGGQLRVGHRRLPARWLRSLLPYGPYKGLFGTDAGVLVHLLPYLEQGQTYNAINFKANICWSFNHTVHATGIAAYWCPSDAAVRDVGQLSNLYWDVVGESSRLRPRDLHQLRRRLRPLVHQDGCRSPGSARTPSTHSKNLSRWGCSI